jgi:hypothetical protein
VALVREGHGGQGEHKDGEGAHAADAAGLWPRFMSAALTAHCRVGQTAKQAQFAPKIVDALRDGAFDGDGELGRGRRV